MTSFASLRYINVADLNAAGRSQALDVLRFVAVALVILRHCPPNSLMQRGGWIGVDLFFVLSGFLVSGLLFNSYRRYGQLGTWRFYVRRGFKIYPAFYLLVIATILVKALNGETVSLRHLLSEILFIQNYLPGLWNHTWSLAIEEHFYLVLPPLIAILLRRRSCLLPVLGVFCVAVLAGRFHAVYTGPINYRTTLFPTHTRVDSLLFGVILAYLWQWHHEPFVTIIRRHRALLLLTAVVAAAPAFVTLIESDVLMNTIGLTLLYIGFGALLAVAMVCNADWCCGQPMKTLAKIGEHSYSIYLWHVPLLVWLPWEQWFPEGWLKTAVYALTVCALGMGLALIIERPMLRLRDRLFPSTGRAL